MTAAPVSAADDRLIPRHRPAGASAALPLTARDLAPDIEHVGQVEPLGAGWLTVTVIIGVMAALIALGGMVLSFRAVSTEMIPAFGARWAWLVPIVVDMTVFVFSGVDLVLARLDMSHPLARWTVYGATGGTVWLNYSVGGSVAGRVAHVLMPAIWVVFVELMRHVVRRQANLATGSHREPIPTARWLLSPWPTLKLWRRMVLWRVHSYPRALDQEKMRLGAVAAARETHGRLWRYRISPLTRLQINLGELGANDLRPGAAGVATAAASATALPEINGSATLGHLSAAVVNGVPAYEPHAQAQHAYGPTGVPDVQNHAEAPTGPTNGAATVPAQRPQPPVNGTDPLPGVAAAGAAAGAVARETAAQQTSNGSQQPPGTAVPAQRAHAAPPAVPFPPNGRRENPAPNPAQNPARDAGQGEGAARQEPPHVEFQAPPPMPQLPRRSVRESELLTAARQVERWRGQPSATRIGRELGVGAQLANFLANALREEDGLAPDET
ncbi:MAG TPA: DUF2637 domain-containing protein [Actinocrinis sp.]|nr:DUF2637 domain-containing protein [Actinocrinis sp.]